MVRSLGADHVIDYTKEDFTKGDQRYDVILDNVANHSLSEFRRALNPKGIYVMIGGGGPNEEALIGPWLTSGQSDVLSKFVSQKMGMMHGGPESKGPDYPGRSHAVRKGHTGNRQNLQVKRDPTGYSISGTRACSRKSSNSSRLTLN